MQDKLEGFDAGTSRVIAVADLVYDIGTLVARRGARETHAHGLAHAGTVDAAGAGGGDATGNGACHLA